MFRIAWAKIGAVGTMRMLEQAFTASDGSMESVMTSDFITELWHTLHRRAGQHAMGDIAVNLGGAIVHQQLGRFAQGASGVADVIDDDALLALDSTDHGHAIHFARLFAALVHDGQRAR